MDHGVGPLSGLSVGISRKNVNASVSATRARITAIQCSDLGAVTVEVKNGAMTALEVSASASSWLSLVRSFSTS